MVKRVKRVGELSNEDVARLLEVMARNPASDVRQLAKAEGFGLHAVDKFLRHMREQAPQTAEAVRALGHNDMIEVLTEKLTLTVNALTKEKLDATGARDLAIVFGILTEKRELLKGKPTQIFSFEERRKTGDLLSVYVKDAQRRGIVVDATYVEVGDDVSPKVIQAEHMPREFDATENFRAKLPTEREV